MKVIQMPPVHAANLVENSGNTAYGFGVIQTTVLLHSSSPDSQQNRESFYHVILSVLHTLSWACFLSLARSKLRLCSTNHRAGYFSNLACDRQKIVWVYSDDPANFPVLQQCYTENFLCYENINTCNSLPSCHDVENTSAFPILRIPARMRRILRIILHGE